VAGSCEHSNKHSGPIKGREFLDGLSGCKLQKKNSASWRKDQMQLLVCVVC
jgi:hypothetical protein